MVQRLLFVAIAGAAVICDAQLATPNLAPRNSVSITFWNIQWFPGRRPNATRGEEQRQIDEVHRDIAQISSDIVAMEEVRDWNAAALAVQPLAGFHVDVCSTFPPREGQTDTQQVAITSRLWPISAWSELWKPGAAITPPRGFAFAAYEIAPKQLLLVYALHLKSNRGEIHEDMAIRSESIRQLISHMDAMQNAYTKLGAISWAVGGDFNTAPDDPRFRGEKSVAQLLANGFNWCWENVPLQQRITLPPDQRFPAACFDHIFYRGATLERASVSNTSARASDHRAVNATLMLPTR
jgi:endonuclease/exonuclease/phosphatase (EEP) superfamily protein YafD